VVVVVTWRNVARLTNAGRWETWFRTSPTAAVETPTEMAVAMIQARIVTPRDICPRLCRIQG
jgi:hypothetical protein